MRGPIPIVIAAIVLILLSLPLIFKKVPKNHYYGIRTSRTMSGSNEQWYAVNQTGGYALAIAGAITLLSCFIAPRLLSDNHTVTLLCAGVLVASVLISLGVSLVIK
jgi:uncharacterized membrane protein